MHFEAQCVSVIDTQDNYNEMVASGILTEDQAKAGVLKAINKHVDAFKLVGTFHSNHTASFACKANVNRRWLKLLMPQFWPVALRWIGTLQPGPTRIQLFLK